MYLRRLPHPPRRWSGVLPSTLRVLQRPILHLEVVEQPLEDGNPKGCRACRKEQLQVMCAHSAPAPARRPSWSCGAG